jgi:hypothetical protein
MSTHRDMMEIEKSRCSRVREFARITQSGYQHRSTRRLFFSAALWHVRFPRAPLDQRGPPASLAWLVAVVVHSTLRAAHTSGPSSELHPGHPRSPDVHCYFPSASHFCSRYASCASSTRAVPGRGSQQSRITRTRRRYLLEPRC